ncbi:hypothetical protein BDY21DRAFT_361162 [Lineolata rhizophorae]|uniref:DUF7924 domain-containing protein n=1 Tax=Lineolata rhizophorae TaxID=578093 RepID=A0A6A6PBQ4_9PEZI|nr:hypothetical protein BDY21DRAFT_361162 [Lineolata rhizophorae]
MNGRITKARTRRSREKPSKALEEKLVDALPRSHQQPPANRGPSRDLKPVPTAKRQFDAISSEKDPLPAKRTRLMRTDTERLGVDEEIEKVAKTTLQQPKPNPPKLPYASFLKDFLDPVHSHPRPVSLHAAVSEWLESVGSDREKCCRSDGHLYRSDDDPVSRQPTKSVPEMGYTQDANGFLAPPTPASTESLSYQVDADAGAITPSDVPSSSRSGRSLVEDPYYRYRNLALNNIFMRNPDEKFPDDVANLVRHVGKDRNSPGPSPDQVRCDAGLYQLEMETVDEPGVEKYFHTHTPPDPKPSGSLKRTEKQPMAKHTVPNTTRSNLKVSNPIPDLLYGYNCYTAFPQQQAQLISMRNEPMANTQSLTYPFFVIEFKGNGGDLWVATNQCLGGFMSCVNMAERLNEQLRKCKSDMIQAIDSPAFSIAMNGTEARLYISWKHDELDYYMRKVESFALQKPKYYIEFRKYVRNIIDWGKDKRLNEIQASLDKLDLTLSVDE